MRSVSITAFRLASDTEHLLILAFADTPRYRNVGDHGLFTDREFLELLERLGVSATDATGYLEHTVPAPKRLNVRLRLTEAQFEYLQIQFPEIDA